MTDKPEREQFIPFCILSSFVLIGQEIIFLHRKFSSRKSFLYKDGLVLYICSKENKNCTEILFTLLKVFIKKESYTFLKYILIIKIILISAF